MTSPTPRMTGAITIATAHIQTNNTEKTIHCC